jgi:predicted nicotinamide N-methyase
MNRVFSRITIQSIQISPNEEVLRDVKTNSRGKRMVGKANVVFRYPVMDKSVLDVGAWNGYFSFEAERRGASRVLATDHFYWSGDGWGTKAGFLAHDILGSHTESKDIDIGDIWPATVGKWDVVLCMGSITFGICLAYSARPTA